MSEEQAIGIMGGTFDPIHYGHLMLADCALDQFKLEQVIFVPSANPPHKFNKKITPVEMRYEMTLLATMDNPYFTVSKVEMKRPGSSYTIDTVKYFRERYPEYQIYFITGADTILEIDTWKSPNELMQIVYFIAAVRPGYSFERLEKEFYQKYRDRIFFLEMPEIGISSTDIRNRIKAGKTIKYQVHPAVEAYIKKYQLYLKE
ncbi:nicotinate (nicotinamide) nucleotide adenylyltransferase [Anoxybacter fermentans]|uniref:Probable nicotinate-nucleotide adenylyltransferase n=1 Tax=Anoxybacter fermentans TaxID=1323375 RepID=A0A3Q9HQ69_9FIRM|nr:nicotinate-nucleotide adenylyltransferase [Anoxybacter fermentans]AZR73206.1 nicotinate (nicotinamide) nucleotide adenylyltransferase [Anoxybacter fermentans]